MGQTLIIVADRKIYSYHDYAVKFLITFHVGLHLWAFKQGVIEMHSSLVFAVSTV